MSLLLLNILKNRSLIFKIIVVFGFGFLIGLLSFIFISKTSNKNILPDGTMTVEASGKTEWLYFDNHELDVNEFGTPEQPKGEDIIPVENRRVNKNETAYTTLNDTIIFSRSRDIVSGSIFVKVTDLTAIDQDISNDKAEMEATFSGPNGSNFKIVLNKLFPGKIPTQTFGGVGSNSLIHGHTGVGINKIFSEFAYIFFYGLGDIYRDGQLINKDMFVYFAVSQRSRALNEDFLEGRYNVSNPMGKLIVHLVVFPRTLTDDGTLVDVPFSTGVIGKDGKDQEFFHINYLENIIVKGNKFIK